MVAGLAPDQRIRRYQGAEAGVHAQSHSFLEGVVASQVEGYDSYFRCSRSENHRIAGKPVLGYVDLTR